MNHGKQLRLFLPDGTPSGPRYYELVNWTGQALQIPVTRIKDLVSGEWPEFQRPGIYFVRGQSEDGHPRLYIGESENVANRVQGHPIGLGFETVELLLFSSKDDNLTKSHVLWLEIQLIQRAQIAKRITLSNSKKPPLKTLSKAEEATMVEFVENVELIAQTAGYSFFKAAPQSLEETVEKFHIHKEKQGLTATAIRTDDGFVVLAGSQASGNTTPALAKGYVQQREDLIDQGVLQGTEEGKLVFTVDAVFASSSAAAAIIAGYPSSGPQSWRNVAGMTLKELTEREQTAALLNEN